VSRVSSDREPDGGGEDEPGVADEVLDAVLGTLARWRAEGRAVTVVAIDAPGASGKSTIAEHLASRLELSLVHTDDFFEPARSARHRQSSLRDYYDLERLRVEALEPLRAGQEAVFRCFDWDAGTLSRGHVHLRPNEVVVVEGVYSGSPELADLVDKVIYVLTPETERLRRLRRLIAPGDWDEEWLAAEKAYFDTLRPLESVDLVVSGQRIVAT
jgi:uridine kinase